jgi:predicted ABC-class ATPase
MDRGKTSIQNGLQGGNVAEAEMLRRKLNKIDGRGYRAYKDIRGQYDFEDFRLSIDYVQGDPFASPSSVSVLVRREEADFPHSHYDNQFRRAGLEDYLTRAFASAIGRVVTGKRGSGKSGAIFIDRPGQEILERTSCFVRDGSVELRFKVGLPAAGRRVLGKQAGAMFFDEIPSLVRSSMYYRSLNEKSLSVHIESNEDQSVLRNRLEELRLIAFIADGSVLPRRSGIDDRPLLDDGNRKVVPFRSPDSMRVSISLPHSGEVQGMGIKEGINLIVGGGFHGKSTLLRAIERGVYNHIPGDGRELVVARMDAVKIRSENGRSTVGVDIRPFIQNLPFGTDTSGFTSENASGSTSQAANIMEALEMGSRFLLIDEDTSATNFMIRDERMQSLVPKDKEPITPFLDKVSLLKDDLDVSTILVMGGSGDYFEVADCVIMMDSYTPVDVTDVAKTIVSSRASGRVREGGKKFGRITCRTPSPNSFDPMRGRKKRVKIKARGLKSIQFGRDSIDLSSLEQLVDISQTRAIGDMIFYYSTEYAGKYSLKEGLEMMMKEIDRGGMDLISRFKEGDYAKPRIFEVAAAINRMRALRLK